MSEITKEDALLDAAIAFLEEKGAKLAVIGGIAIQHQRGGYSSNHELVIRFTGLLPEQASAS